MAQLPAPDALDPLGPGSYCASCGAALVRGAHWCHRCGVPAGTVAAAPAPALRRVPAPSPDARPGEQTAGPSVLPWGAAFVALMAVVALFAGRSFANARASAGTLLAAPVSDAGPDAGVGLGAATPPAAAAPDISNLSPEERADRLYERVMIYEAQQARDSLRLFAPMAMRAHELLTELSLERRYHVGQIAEVVGLPELAMAQADTILASDPEYLLGLVLAARASRLRADGAAARRFDQRLLRAASNQSARPMPAYDQHRTEIEQELAIARGEGGG